MEAYLRRFRWISISNYKLRTLSQFIIIYKHKKFNFNLIICIKLHDSIQYTWSIWEISVFKRNLNILNNIPCPLHNHCEQLALKFRLNYDDIAKIQ